MTMLRDDGVKHGRKMLALPSNRMRRFVLALLVQGSRNQTRAYEAAGYTGTPESLRVGASRLAHDQRIQAALQEEAARRATGLLPLAMHVVEGILEDETAKAADRLKVAFGIMDRAGLRTPREDQPTVGLAGDAETLTRIKRLAERCGIPLRQLLGDRLARTVEGDGEDVTRAAVATP
jgi:hypothetical protein